MVPETASRLVGLITIEAVPPQSNGAIAPCGEQADATLGQFLLYLAGGSTSKRGDPVELARTTPAAEPGIGRRSLDRFDSATARAWQQPIRLSADLKTLAAQLDLAMAQARRQVAVARRLGG